MHPESAVSQLTWGAEAQSLAQAWDSSAPVTRAGAPVLPLPGASSLFPGWCPQEQPPLTS